MPDASGETDSVSREGGGGKRQLGSLGRLGNAEWLAAELQRYVLDSSCVQQQLARRALYFTSC